VDPEDPKITLSASPEVVNKAEKAAGVDVVEADVAVVEGVRLRANLASARLVPIRTATS
jgi:hypothetical protein